MDSTTLNGQRVDIKVEGDAVKVDGAQVVKTDIMCTNGIIHVIDSVILPSTKDIVTTASEAGQFGTLIAAAKAAGLVEALTGDGPLTVFAPTDKAFSKLPEGTVASLLKPENKDKLAAILKYHVVSGRIYSTDALEAGKAKTLQGSTIKIRVKNGDPKVQNAKLIATDIDASNGVIHVIDRVILPPEGAKQQAKKVGAVDAHRLIENAIAKGAPLYNAGHHQACAKVYMTTLSQLMQSEMPTSVSTKLQHMVSSANHHTCPTQQAWAARHGLDYAYAAVPRN